MFKFLVRAISLSLKMISFLLPLIILDVKGTSLNKNGEIGAHNNLYCCHVDCILFFLICAKCLYLQSDLTSNLGKCGESLNRCR